MKFAKLTMGKFERPSGGGGAAGLAPGRYIAGGAVSVNLSRIAYFNPHKDGGTEITFMDYEESSCCLIVMDPFEEIERLVRT